MSKLQQPQGVLIFYCSIFHSDILKCFVLLSIKSRINDDQLVKPFEAAVYLFPGSCLLP